MVKRESVLRATALAAICGLAWACSAYDFFGYEEDAPLHVIERPEGYPSARFGAELAPTTAVIDGSHTDLLAVSAGDGSPTIFYRLAAGGDLLDVTDPWDDHLADETGQAQLDHSGASLAGLPVWSDELLAGCVAIGEPGKRNVRIDCEQDDDHSDISADMLNVHLETHLPQNLLEYEHKEDFGLRVASIPPVAGSKGWLLAVASRYWAIVFSSGDDPIVHSTVALPSQYDQLHFWGDVIELAAGRLGDDRIYLAVTTATEVQGTNEVANRLHLFFQVAPNHPDFQEVETILRPSEPGFAGVMTTGDLDGDGDDDLVVSAAPASNREEVVYVYDVDCLRNPDTCPNPEDPEEPVVTIAPEPGIGPIDAVCGKSNNCSFGGALAVGDIATDDGTPELVVGAPRASIKGEDQAGVVYIYRGADVMDGAPVSLAGQVAHSTPEAEHRFGGGVAVAPMAGRNELIVGMIGKGKLVIAFCTGVGHDLNEGGDVTTNASGSVISTRCRL